VAGFERRLDLLVDNCDERGIRGRGYIARSGCVQGACICPLSVGGVNIRELMHGGRRHQVLRLV
jgi:hypothetical protein